MMKIVILLSLFLCNNIFFGQVPKEYIQYAKEADSLRENNMNKKALKKYLKAFNVLGNKGYLEERFNVAVVSSRLGKNKLAFENLELIVNKLHYSDTNELLNKVSYQKLKKKDLYRWNGVISNMKINRMRLNYSNFIDSLCDIEQKWMNLLTQVRNKEIDTIPKEKVKSVIREIKSSNYYFIKALVDCNIIPNIKDFRYKTVHKFWLIVQHQDANIELQRKVLNKIYEYVKLNQFPKTDYAYLKDRVLINSKKKTVIWHAMRC